MVVWIQLRTTRDIQWQVGQVDLSHVQTYESLNQSFLRRLGGKHIALGVESAITMALSHDGSAFFFLFFGGPLQGMNNNDNMYNGPFNIIIKSDK